MKILIVTDAWHPQVNGVVKTLARTCAELRQMGHQVEVIHPGMFRSVPTPFEPGLRAALVGAGRLAERIDRFAPDALHVATEGPLGWAARNAALRTGRRFTTAFHTRYPEYLKMRMGIPATLTGNVLRRFHQPSQAVMVPTRSILTELAHAGFANLAVWGRGVDQDIFQPGTSDALAGLPRPIFLYVGRVSREKSLPEFLSLSLPGCKVVIGDGPELTGLRTRFPDVRFLGSIEHRKLPGYYQAADAFVFPSRTDTFGLVLLEALACGLPVAAYPAPGPTDVLTGCPAGITNDNLHEACLQAIQASREAAVHHARKHCWTDVTRRFVSLLAAPCLAANAEGATDRNASLPSRSTLVMPATHRESRYRWQPRPRRDS